MAGYWHSVRSSAEAPHDDVIRGSFHLACYPQELPKVWRRICKLTRGDALGHWSSHSSDVMHGEYWKWRGAHTISVHTVHKQRKQVKAALVRARLGDRIFKYNLIKRFRICDDDEGPSSGSDEEKDQCKKGEDQPSDIDDGFDEEGTEEEEDSDTDNQYL